MTTPQLWAADPHQYGPGKIHFVDPDKPEQTYCGKMLAAFSGKPITHGEATCMICRNAPLKRQQQAAEQEAREKEWQERRTEFERDRILKDSDWWHRYNQYLLSPKWRAIRSAVMFRAKNLCEGCGINEATQVHHLTYEHMGDEFLWELVAVCAGCHERVHNDHP